MMVSVFAGYKQGLTRQLLTGFDILLGFVLPWVL